MYPSQAAATTWSGFNIYQTPHIITSSSKPALPNPEEHRRYGFPSRHKCSRFVPLGSLILQLRSLPPIKNSFQSPLIHTDSTKRPALNTNTSAPIDPFASQRNDSVGQNGGDKSASATTASSSAATPTKDAGSPVEDRRLVADEWGT